MVSSNDLFYAAVKAIRAIDNMPDNEYIKQKEQILTECAGLGHGAQAFLYDLFEIADKRRERKKV